MTKTVGNAKRGGFLYFAALILYLSLSLIGQEILQVLYASETVKYAVGSLFSVSAFAFFTVMYVKNGGEFSGLRKFSPVYLLPAFLLAAGMLLGLGFLNSLVAEGVKSVGGVVTDVQVPLDTPLNYLLFTVLLCLFPAIAEELFFRGVLLSSLSGVKKAAGVFTVALCFALYHGNVAQLFFQFIYGLGLGFLTLKAKSVLPAIIAHFLNNFAVLSLEYFKIPFDFTNPFVIAAGAVIITGFILFLVFYDANPFPAQSKTDSIKDFYIPFGALGVIATSLLIILSALPI